MQDQALQIKKDGDTLTIRILRPFKFDMYKDFRTAYINHVWVVNHYIIDLGKVDLLDSSALGMLMLLYKETKARNMQATVTLTNAKPQVLTLLKASNLEDIFTIA
ncbi:MAG: STAS domain-containing protein [Magnetococcus sp. YQC-5]